MDDDPLYRKPWAYIVGWLAILLVVYGWQIYRMGGIRANLPEIAFDLACVFPLLLILWMAFFAQFVLPVRTFRNRQKIFDRLITYLFGGHGPAIFIRNGELIKREGEERQKGPGVLWLDSASAAVTRTAVAIQQTIGPGVHFLNNGEYIAGTVDLHIQSQFVGPKESDKPFGEKKEDQTQEEWDQIQDRRKQVSALTRDGIEVIPNISISFRVKTGFPKEGQPGSRFGYRTGVTRRDKENERRDKEAIYKAILGEGINPNAVPARRRVAWNELPAALAVDVWREYVAKFTLDELFKPDQIVPPPPLPVQEPTEEEIDPLSQPILVGANRDAMRDGFARMVRELNLMMSRAIRALEDQKEPGIKKPIKPQPFNLELEPKEKKLPKGKTALQVINDMVKARLTQPEVDILDDTGRRREGTIPSPEYKLLQDRALEVLSVGIFSPRFNPTVEEQIIRQWNATWLGNAILESKLIDRERNLLETTAQERAIRQYADTLSREINEVAKEGKPNEREMLKTLVLRSRSMIRSSEQLRRRMSTELQDIDEIIKWIEENGS